MNVIFPGSFYPFTIGHKDILDQALRIFDKVYVCYGKNPNKTLSGEFAVLIDEQMDKLDALYGDKIEIIKYDCLLSDLCERLNCYNIIRGLRNSKDFEYEKELANINKSINKQINTIFLIASDPKLEFMSSSFVREMYKYNKNISKFII